MSQLYGYDLTRAVFTGYTYTIGSLLRLSNDKERAVFRNFPRQPISNMKKIKQILAWTGIVVLVGMYLVTLLLAIFDHTASMTMFRVAAGCTILIPIMLYAYMLVYKWTKNRDDDRTEDGKKTK